MTTLLAELSIFFTFLGGVLWAIVKGLIWLGSLKTTAHVISVEQSNTNSMVVNRLNQLEQNNAALLKIFTECKIKQDTAQELADNVRRQQEGV